MKYSMRPLALTAKYRLECAARESGLRSTPRNTFDVIDLALVFDASTRNVLIVVLYRASTRVA
jgi:hypothetical protein